MAGAKGPNDNDSDFLIPDDDDDEQQDDNGLPTSKKSNVIPNFRGKVPEPELPDSKGPIQVPILSSLLFPFQLHFTLRIVRRSPFRSPKQCKTKNSPRITMTVCGNLISYWHQTHRIEVLALRVRR